MTDIFDVLITQCNALFIILATVAIDFILRPWFATSKYSQFLMKTVMAFRILNPCLAMLIVTVTFLQRDTIFDKLTSISVGVAMFFYFSSLLRKKWFINLNNLLVMLIFLSCVYGNIPTASNGHEQFLLLISILGTYTLLIINYFRFDYEIMVVKWQLTSFKFIIIYSMGWWSIFLVDTNLTLKMYIGQVLLSIVYIIVIIFMDKGINKQLQIKLREIAQDFLTGIGDRTIFERELTKLFNNNDKTNNHLVLFDIDRFKQINDEYGHSMGDSALRIVSQTVIDELDVLQLDENFFRVGGEEFALLFSGLNKQKVIHTVSKIRDSINQLDLINTNDKPIKITLSIGIAKCSQTDQDKQTLYKRVDSYLYIAKNTDKNLINYEGENINE